MRNESPKALMEGSTGEVIKTPEDVAATARLKAYGWGIMRIARALGCSHHAVKHYVAAGGAVVCRRIRSG